VDYLLGRKSDTNKNKSKKNNFADLDPAYFRLSKEAQKEGISPEDIRLAIDFIKRSREKIKGD
jgi:hypothetical protein